MAILAAKPFMNFLAKLAPIFFAPFLAFSAFFGMNHAATSASATASTTALSASSTQSASTTATTRNPLHFPGSNGGVKLPPGLGTGGYDPGGPMIPAPAPASTTPVSTAPTAASPTITSESATSGAVGSEVTFTGTGFTSRSIVHFAAGAVQNTTVSDNGTKLTFTIPSSLGAYCKPDQACPMYEMLVQDGTYKMYVENVPVTGDATGPISNTVSFTVTGSANVL